MENPTWELIIVPGNMWYGILLRYKYVGMSGYTNFEPAIWICRNHQNWALPEVQSELKHPCWAGTWCMAYIPLSLSVRLVIGFHLILDSLIWLVTTSQVANEQTSWDYLAIHGFHWRTGSISASKTYLVAWSVLPFSFAESIAESTIPGARFGSM